MTSALDYAVQDEERPASSSNVGCPVGETLSAQLSDEVLSWFRRRNGETLQGALAFVPWVLQQSWYDKQLEPGRIVMHRGKGAVVFSDASGFTALTERLAVKSNGAELLSQCLTAFFTPLIDLINAYRGDVIKFSGDALTIYFEAVDDTKNPRYNPVVPPHGTYGLQDLGPEATAVLRASACCIEIHKRLHMFDTGVDGVRLCLHIGVGQGEVAVLQVGGIVPPETHVPRFEYIIAGNPLQQISIAEPLAKNGETCLSPQAWDFVKDSVIEGNPLEDRPDFHLLLRMDENKFTFPTIKYSAKQLDSRINKQFKLTELNVIRRYIPSAVFKQIEGGTLPYVNEMRDISTIFISGSGVDVSTDRGAEKAQLLMSKLQQYCYSHEGTLNKFVIDDKGMLFLLVFGLPPLVHTDDPTRAVLACMDIAKVFNSLDLVGRFGVTTGRNYCGVCGSASRMEYTVLGDTVNLSARLMANAPALGILCDEATKNRATNELTCKALTPIMVKGKANAISIFQPSQCRTSHAIGIGANKKIHFPWADRGSSGVGPIVAGGGAGKTLGTSSNYLNVRRLCGVSNWHGITELQHLLGGRFSKEIHRQDGIVQFSSSGTPAPHGTPFADGGVLVLEGQNGLGKIELAEHIVMHCATHLQMLPIFGSMGPRPGNRTRILTELLRSTLSLLRYTNSSIPQDDMQALTRVAPSHFQAQLADMRQIIGEPAASDSDCKLQEEASPQIQESALSLVVELLTDLREKTAIVTVLQLEYGTSLFQRTREEFNGFWNIVSRLFRIAERSAGKPFVLVIMYESHAKTTANHPAIQAAERSGSVIQLNGLSEDNITEYICYTMDIREDLLPQQLRAFIAKITLGNPLYIRETIDQLQKTQHVQQLRDGRGNIEKLVAQDLDGINIAAWNHTSMVGETICLLESLDPLEAAVVKMSTVFTGDPFTLSDLAATQCSQWSGATHFDNLRLLRAIRKLVEQHIIEGVDQTDSKGIKTNNPYFKLRNVLIRKVGGAMVLEAQKKAVKRQALVDRALARELPQRMQQLYRQRKVPHIPWYYENVLPGQ